MKYYSSETKKMYDSEKECLDAERAYLEERDAEKKEKEKQAAERKACAEEVTNARKIMFDAQANYKKALNNFIERYGSYHYSSNSVKDIPTLFSSWLEDWF